MRDAKEMCSVQPKEVSQGAKEAQKVTQDKPDDWIEEVIKIVETCIRGNRLESHHRCWCRYRIGQVARKK